MTTCKTVKATPPLFSTAALTNSPLPSLLVSLYKEHFLFQSTAPLEQALPFFLTDSSRKTSVLSARHAKVLQLFFEEEYLFVLKAFPLISSYSDRPANSLDFLLFLEIVLQSSWPAATTEQKIADFITRLDALSITLSRQLNISWDDLKKEHANFLRHLKFLAFRIEQHSTQKPTENNELAHFIQSKYPHSFSQAKKLQTLILQSFHFDLSDSELAFLALHIERIQTKINE